MSITPVSLVLFTMLMLVISLHGLTASGHFPARNPAAGDDGRRRPAVLWLTILIVVASLLAGLLAAWR